MSNLSNDFYNCKSDILLSIAGMYERYSFTGIELLWYDQYKHKLKCLIKS